MKIDDKLKELEKITTRLEKDDLPLEEAIDLFEQGIALATTVKEELSKAKLRIQQVVEKTDGLFQVDDFDLK